MIRLFEGIRLVGGAGPFEGRVELNINGQWGTICDTDFDLADAEVLCRMAGYSRALQRFYRAYFGEGTGQVFLDHLRCRGNEQHLDSCPSSGKPGKFTTEGIRHVGGAGPFEGRVELNINGQWGTICDTDFDLADAEVLCPMAGYSSIRFVDGPGPFEGRVEININGQWGTICDKQFGLADAEVLCRMAGYSRALQAFVGGSYGEGTGPVFFQNLGCKGNEKHLDSCSTSGLFATSCRHSQDVGVACLNTTTGIDNDSSTKDKNSETGRKRSSSASENEKVDTTESKKCKNTVRMTEIGTIKNLKRYVDKTEKERKRKTDMSKELIKNICNM
ncbi:scavenger receptor cysteine-rich domain superfamily protein-like [Mytilus californianus]|uniref:scavenger receptor cysteine-rich domain superfamily protein-like n=1 Tax=Mytilus californianus TaxID=6549 RepID=UPI0022457A1A|nr:scavenger receptor cysteine-rich domain superfamily protein-like [Mytilus californianus]